MPTLSKTFGKLTIPLLVLLAICFWASPAHAKYGGGTGESNDPYLIYTAEQMNEIGLSGNWDDFDKHFLLCADIDLAGFTGTDFNIIGERYYDEGWIENPFTGVFDGNSHTISNFSYTSTDRGDIGLFGYVRGAIKNLGLLDPNVDAGTGGGVGSLVGYLREATITNCYVEDGSVAGRSRVGGLVGDNRGTITNCYSTGSILGTGWNTGGLAGYNTGTITNCYATGNVTGDRYVGGLIGHNRRHNGSGKIHNCYTSADVSGDERVGGLVGLNYDGTITNCYATGSVTGIKDTGGLVAYNSGYVINSYWNIETSGQPISAGGEGKTSAQMMMADTFLNWGACDGVWTINEDLDYPRLAWEEKPGEPIVNAFPLEGDGDSSSPYLIYTTDELNVIGQLPCSWDKHFKLMADIDLTQYTGTEFNIIAHFTGVFDGNGHTISNFTYTSTGTDYIGLFGYIDDLNAEIKNLGLLDPDIHAGTGNDVGSLVGQLSGGTITNCYVEDGSVAGRSSVGGLVGWNNSGTINNCYTSADVSGDERVGGLVGDNSWGTITNCYSTASVSGVWWVAGLVGSNHEGTISNCYSTGSVAGNDKVGGLVGENEFGTITISYAVGSASGTTNVGGLVGLNYGTITNCYSTGSVSGNYRVGGLVGAHYYGTITNCYATASVSGNYRVGGLVGAHYYGTISNCYSTGSVTGADFVGGLVGGNRESTIANCYATGTVWGDTRVGGLVGYNYKGEVVNAFWDTQTSGQSTSDGGTGLPTAEMQTMSTFTDAGWDFTTPVWTIDEGVDYPRLWWEEKYGGGSGHPNDPYLIYTAEQLNTIGLVRCHWDKHFLLCADIDLSGFPGTSFNIIGTYPDNPFTGTFDGSDHTISNFTYTTTGTDYIGLFVYVRGAIKNLGLLDPNVDGGTGNLVGSLVGLLRYGTITNCYVEGGSVSGNSHVGGFVGSNRNGTITNCYSTGSVSGDDAVGGLVGGNWGGITNCYAASGVSGKYDVGGLVGYNSWGTIANCYSTGSVVAGYNVGGLVGQNYYGTISNCYSEGDVSGDGSVGGLVGYNRGTISNCYSEGDVSGTRWPVGGLVGYNMRTISNSYSTGDVLGDQPVGGLVGFKWGGEVTNSFWDVNTSGLDTSAGGTGLPTAEMQTESTFIDAGWDFNTPVWTIDEGVDYPRLWWELVPVLHGEPEVTLGTSNTISWEPVPGANDYYAECAADANFTSIIYNTGWIIEISYEFTGLELGQRYWYSVKARNIAGVETGWSNVESSLQGTLGDLVDAIDMMLDPDTLKNKNMKNALLNKINAVQQMLDKGRYEEALNKLQNDILQKTNGCAETGEPDKNDWIITCEGQSVVYPLIIETIEYVRGLMNQ